MMCNRSLQEGILPLVLHVEAGGKDGQSSTDSLPGGRKTSAKVPIRVSCSPFHRNCYLKGSVRYIDSGRPGEGLDPRLARYVGCLRQSRSFPFFSIAWRLRMDSLGTVLSWMRSFLTDRDQRVVFGGSSSATSFVKFGGASGECPRTAPVCSLHNGLRLGTEQFESWQFRIYIQCSLSLRLLGSLRGSLGTYGLTQKLCLKKSKPLPPNVPA